MPGFGALVAAISADVVTRLGALSVVLTDGGILIGRQWLASQSAPPRIVFVPTRSRFDMGRDSYGVDVQAKRSQWLQRSIGSEFVHFDVHVWGAATPPDPNGGDFDATQVLYQALYQSLWDIAQSSFTMTEGTWVDQAPGESQLQKLGHEFVFDLEIGTPILDVELEYVPQTGTTGQIAVQFNGASSEQVVIPTIPTTP